MKPMLASPLVGEVNFPVMVSPKLDGIRCLIIDGVACSRSLKPIPNKYVQQLFGKPEFNGLDGELIVGKAVAKDVFQCTTSGVMSVEGTPGVTFYVFDDFSEDEPFTDRLRAAVDRVHKSADIQILRHRYIDSHEDLLFCEEYYLSAGYEGLMLRHPYGPYKQGRATSEEGWLLKVKRFADAEATIIGCTELMHNANAAQFNLLGHSERSSHKAGKVGKQTLGALIVKDIETGIEFEIGTGFTAVQREYFFFLGQKGLLAGKIVKYKSQPTGVKDKPRFPVFLGFRDILDM